MKNYRTNRTNLVNRVLALVPAFVSAAALAAALVLAPAARAQITLSSNTPFSFSASSAAGVGLPFTTGGTAGASYNSIVFTFLNGGNGTTPSSTGTGFLLSQAYTGTPNNLSSATPGYLDSVAASGGRYSFSSAVLQANTTYYLYQRGASQPYYVAGGGTTYTASSATSNYSAAGGGSPRYTVTGIAAAAAPEPGSIALLGLGGMGLAGTLFTRRRKGGKA